MNFCKPFSRTFRSLNIEPNRVAGLLVLATAAVSFFGAAATMSARSPFWFDEILSVLHARDPSFGHMLHSLAAGTESNPPVFPVASWLWVRVWGEGTIQLRSLSTLGFFAGFTFTWVAVRRRLGFWPATMGCSGAFFLSSLVFEQIANARPYGLMIGFVGAVLLHYELADSGRIGKWSVTGFGFLLHGLLALTHVYGLAYSAAFAMARAVSDFRRGKVSLSYFIGLAMGWIAFLPWMGSFVRQSGMFTGRSWLGRPSLVALVDGMGSGIRFEMFLVALFLGILLRVAFSISAPVAAADDLGGNVWPLLVVATLMVCIVPSLAWLESRLMVPVFRDRFMIPGVIGWAVLFSWLVRVGIWPGNAGPAKHGGASRFAHTMIVYGTMCVAGFFAIPVIKTIGVPYRLPPEIPAAIMAIGLPVAVENAHEFLPLAYYSAPQEEVCFVLDSNVVGDPRSTGAEITNFRILRAVGAYYPEFCIVEGSTFLQQHSDFLVIDSEKLRWSERFVERHTSFTSLEIEPGLVRVTRLSPLGSGEDENDCN